MSLDISPTAKAKQRAALLAALHTGPLSTVEARERLGVLHVAGRVLELRRQGHNIATRTRITFDAEGRPHRCALYELCEGPDA